MPPKFSLQTVLDVRHTRVEKLEGELAELVHAQTEGKMLLISLAELQDDQFVQLQELQSGNIDLFRVARLRENIEQTKEKIVQVQEALIIIAEKMEAKRKELVTARQDEEVLDTLRRKEVEEWTQEQDRQERNTQDDIYIARAYRQRPQEV